MYLPFRNDPKDARRSVNPLKLNFNEIPSKGVIKITADMDEYADLAQLDTRICGAANCFEPEDEEEDE